MKENEATIEAMKQVTSAMATLASLATVGVDQYQRNNLADKTAGMVSLLESLSYKIVNAPVPVSNQTF